VVGLNLDVAKLSDLGSGLVMGLSGSMMIWLEKAEVVASYMFGSWAVPTLRLYLVV
jgi:hypothetical protein